MKNKNNKQQRNNKNVEFSRDLDCCKNNANVEFANEFNNQKSNNQRRNNNVEFSRNLDRNQRNDNVEFANEFNNRKKSNPNNKGKKKNNANVTRTNAYAGMTEYANELGTARNAVDTLGNDPVTSDFRNITSQSSPYPYAEYEFGNEPLYGDSYVDTRDFTDLENARKSYFERLNKNSNQQKNKKNS